MILFKERFKKDILAGRKTVTRRGGKKRWNVGAVHQLNTSYMSGAFARVRILDVRLEPLGNMTIDEVRKEGFQTLEAFTTAWELINKSPVDWQQDVWRVEFEVVV